MAFGIDCEQFLNTFNWPAWYAWKPQYPYFAGRYFLGDGTPASTTTEFTQAKTQTNNVLTHIFPIVGALDNQDTTGSAGYNYGVDAANSACGLLDELRANHQLSLPTTGNRCIVYADFEAEGPYISANWWGGFSTTVYNFGTSGPYGARRPASRGASNRQPSEGPAGPAGHPG
jgi:hypothetical protein